MKCRLRHCVYRQGGLIRRGGGEAIHVPVMAIVGSTCGKFPNPRDETSTVDNPFSVFNVFTKRGFLGSILKKHKNLRPTKFVKSRPPGRSTFK